MTTFAEPRSLHASRAVKEPPAARRRSRHQRQRLSEATVVFLICAALYAVVGAVLVFGFHSVMEDALSRVSNATYVLYSRQPKLANVGFVWTPLPSLLFLPLLPLKALLPGLVATGYLASLESAIAMALSVRTLSAILSDLRVRRAARLSVVALFAAQPLLVWFGSNGMSEALLILFLLLATRRLMQWLRAEDSRHLVAAGLWLALGYLSRYEVVAAGAAAVALVVAVSWLRSPHRGRRRRQEVVTDGLLIGLPVVVTFAGWALASLVIVGHPFEQFSSQYGNSALVTGERAAGGATAAFAHPHLTLLLSQVWVLAPLLVPVAVVVAVRAVRRRQLDVLAPVALLGAVLAFEVLAYLSGSLFGFLRYQIAVLPLFTVLVGVLLATPDARTSEQGGARPHSRWLPLAAVALLLPGGILSIHTFLTNSTLANQEYYHLRPIALSLAGEPHVDPGANGVWNPDRTIAASLDRMRLPAGSVLLDSGPGFAVLAATHRPRQFVITSDRDFAGAVIDPVGHHIRYLLVNDGRDVYDAIRHTWPDLGSGRRTPWARLAVRYPRPLPGSHLWSLWQVAEPPPRS
jgi:hypothetical protein